MGYTQYTYRSKNFTQKQWEKICLDTLDVLNYCEKNAIELAWECDEYSGGNPKAPEVSDDLIRFNGWQGEGHETFMVTKKLGGYKVESGETFDFCKTARKPYDLAVCLVMLVLKRHAPKSVKLSSDGDWEHEWVEARGVFKQLFGIEAECPFDAAEV